MAAAGGAGGPAPAAGGEAPVAPGAITTTHKTLLVLRSKVVVVGDAAVGKTALCAMFESSGSEYPKQYIMTVGTELRTRALTLGDSAVQVELHLYDHGGQNIFNQRDFGTGQFRDANAVLVVFDVSNRESFTSVAKWIRRVREAKAGKAVRGVLVANKVDLAESGRRVVSADEGRAVAEATGLIYVETSAESTLNVEEPFRQLAGLHADRYHDFVTRVEAGGL